MRIVVVSDTHGAYDRLRFVIRRHENADLLIHLGDGADEFFDLFRRYPNLPMRFCRGNCDPRFSGTLKKTLTIPVFAHRIFACHGDSYSVKGGIENLLAAAKDQGADIILYGHTHEKLTTYQNGVYILNPGSLSHPRNGYPSYGLLDVTPAGVLTSLVEVKRFV